QAGSADRWLRRHVDVHAPLLWVTAHLLHITGDYHHPALACPAWLRRVPPFQAGLHSSVRWPVCRAVRRPRSTTAGQEVQRFDAQVKARVTFARARRGDGPLGANGARNGAGDELPEGIWSD